MPVFLYVLNNIVPFLFQINFQCITIALSSSHTRILYLSICTGPRLFFLLSFFSPAFLFYSIAGKPYKKLHKILKLFLKSICKLIFFNIRHKSEKFNLQLNVNKTGSQKPPVSFLTQQNFQYVLIVSTIHFRHNRLFYIGRDGML